jgi:transcriptional regulator MraZ
MCLTSTRTTKSVGKIFPKSVSFSFATVVEWRYRVATLSGFYTQ